jgi:hypothetical protein
MRISTRVQYLGSLRQGKATRDSIPCNGVTGLYNTYYRVQEPQGVLFSQIYPTYWSRLSK